MTSWFLSIFTFTLLSYFASAQVIQSGPMPGYASMNSVGIWLQLTDSADVKLRYWDLERPSYRSSFGPQCTM